jgi:hypothetical protein
MTYQPINFSNHLDDDGKAYGILGGPHSFATPIKGYQRVSKTGNIQLEEGGILLIRKGYRWDYASGAIDTPAMQYASLPHDAFWDLRIQGLLPAKEFRKVDAYFRECLKQAGAGWFRRHYAWLAVRLYSSFRRVQGR